MKPATRQCSAGKGYPTNTNQSHPTLALQSHSRDMDRIILVFYLTILLSQNNLTITILVITQMWGNLVNCANVHDGALAEDINI